MSMGEGGFGFLRLQDEKTAIYEYGAINLNDSRYANPERKADGIITIEKGSLVEPEIRLKRIGPKKKRSVKKCVLNQVPYEDYIKDGKIQITNSSYCWETTATGEDYIAYLLVRKIYNEYQLTGALPEKISLFY